jgi:hypothetical protein
MGISTVCRWRRDAPSFSMGMFVDYSNVHLLDACLSMPAHPSGASKGAAGFRQN